MKRQKGTIGMPGEDAFKSLGLPIRNAGGGWMDCVSVELGFF